MLYQCSTIGIVAVAVGMLMIGGEFDLSAGVMVTTAGLLNAMFCYQLGINLWVGAVLSLVFCLAIGFLNGYLVMRTGIPSFLITLGTFFVLQGANLGVTKLVTGSVSTPNINQMDGYSSLSWIFAHDFQIGSVTAEHHRHLVVAVRRRCPPTCCSAPRSATGSTPSAATPTPHAPSVSRSPRVKIGLFMTVSFLGWFIGMHTSTSSTPSRPATASATSSSTSSPRSWAARCSPAATATRIGVALGAFIFGMTSLCIVYAGWDPNWFKAFLGVMLLLAVMVNLYVKRLSTTRKVG